MRHTKPLFRPGRPIALGHAPARLDVMGGIADYSGSLVLERPIAEGTCAAVQPIDGAVLEVISMGRPPLSVPIATLIPDGEPIISSPPNYGIGSCSWSAI